jgi:preprotein translocase subunit SecG
MKNTLLLVQILVSVVLSVLILIQAKGTGLGRTFGQSSYHSKRGLEYVIFRFTIGLSVVFVLVAVINLLHV